MKYNGYTAHIEYDEENRVFVGHLAGIRDIVCFHGTTVDELESAFHESVDNYTAISEQTGRPAQRPPRLQLKSASGANPEFMEIIRQSRERHEKEGGISSEEMRRRLGLSE